MKYLFLYSLIGLCLSVFSRGGSGGFHGGGGYHGGGYHGGGYHSSGYHGGVRGGSGYYYSEPRPLTHKEYIALLVAFISVLTALIAYAVYVSYLYFNKSKINKKTLQLRFKTDPFWDYEHIIAHAQTLYLDFQKAWSKGDLTEVKERLSLRLFRNFTGVLNRQRRRGIRNMVEDVTISGVEIIYFDDYINNSKDAIALLIKGELKDYYLPVAQGKTVPKEPFKDALVFIRKNNALILDEILNEPDFYQIMKPKNYIETK